MTAMSRRMHTSLWMAARHNSSDNRVRFSCLLPNSSNRKRNAPGRDTDRSVGTIWVRHGVFSVSHYR